MSVTTTAIVAPPQIETGPQGLSAAEVAARRARGQSNNVKIATSRSYAQILRYNVFTFINVVLFGLGIVMILLGRPDDALVTGGLVLINVVVGVVQEARAKRTLDRIALLTRPHARVVRDGQEAEIDPTEIVLGDLLRAGPGDQIVVDGQIVGDGKMSADESLLTGEADLVAKAAGDTVFSGSFCVSGSAGYVAQKVGSDSFAYQITEGARSFRQARTPLQLDVDYVVRMLAIAVTILGVLILIARIIHPVTLIEGVQTAAVLVSLVPQGLFFMITLTYALGSVRMAGRGALIQQANAVESMSNVSVLCLDKTGTLTSGLVNLRELLPLGLDESTLRGLLGDFAASITASNHTNDAVVSAVPGRKRQLSEEIPFSSEWKWSSVKFTDDPEGRIYVMGAPEVLAPYTALDDAAKKQLADWSAQGLRVLLFGYYSTPVVLREDEGTPHLEPGLQSIGLLCFSDELRAEVQETIKGLAAAGVRVKIISGDNPDTVQALARQAGVPGDLKTISGLELDGLDDAQIAQVAAECTIFGRITPKQKQRLIRTIRQGGSYTAMIGDGVNDVLSLKQANLGIAMQSGSQAARAVADMVLLKDSFAAVPTAFLEGQRIINGMQDVVRLLLTRTFYVVLIIIATAIIGVAFPLTPKYTTVQTLLTVGIPNLALAAWARPGLPKHGLLRSVLHFVFPAAFTIAVFSLGIYLYYLQTTNDVAIARTALTIVTSMCGILLIVFVAPPSEWWVGGDELANDRRPALIALLMALLLLVVVFVPSLRTTFELSELGLQDIAILAAVVVAWTFTLRFIWRGRLFERLLSVPSGSDSK